MADEDGEFPIGSLNDWEVKVLEREMGSVAKMRDGRLRVLDLKSVRVRQAGRAALVLPTCR
jgi:hypothetical protein